MKFPTTNIRHLTSFLLLLLTISCNQLDEETKKEIKKEAKKAGKEIMGALNNAAAKEDIIFYTVNSKNEEIRLYWKDSKDSIIGSLGYLKNICKQQKQRLLFACNGGMYMEDQSPLGWFVHKGKTITSLNTREGKGNFYLQPNGVFIITKNKKCLITSTAKAIQFAQEAFYATQSGPLLIHEGKINSLFNKESNNLNIRNGVGIDSNGNVLFAMSAQPINFYQFAKLYQNHGCKEALYLDGFVSRFYAPAQNFIQTDGEFGVMIGVVGQ
jgi:uncharacterized protein YigE (DUF2233 family)